MAEALVELVVDELFSKGFEFKDESCHFGSKILQFLHVEPSGEPFSIFNFPALRPTWYNLAMFQPAQTSFDTGTSKLETVLRGLENFVSEMKLNVRVSTPKSLNDVKVLSLEDQDLFAEKLETWLSTFKTTPINRSNTGSDERALSSFANLMSCKIDPSFFTTLRDGDCVEVYEFLSDFSGAIQIWRNWKFLELSSYDLTTLTLQPMHELFHRDAKVQAAINELVTGLVRDPRTKPCNLEPHVLTEIKQRHNRQFKIQNRFISPLQDYSGQVIGFICTLEAKPLGSLYADLNVLPLDV